MVCNSRLDCLLPTFFPSAINWDYSRQKISSLIGRFSIQLFCSMLFLFISDLERRPELLFFQDNNNINREKKFED